MKKGIVKTLLAIAATTAVLIEHNNMTVGETIKIKQKAISEVKNLYDYNNIEIHHTNSIEDFNTLTHILENRNGKLVVEVSNGTVINDSGDGIDSHGYYRHYDTSKFSEGDEVQSIFVYNPDTNAIDDIMYRIDILIE